MFHRAEAYLRLTSSPAWGEILFCSCGLSERGQQRFVKTTSIKLPRTKTDCIFVIGITNYLFGLHHLGLEAFSDLLLRSCLPREILASLNLCPVEFLHIQLGSSFHWGQKKQESLNRQDARDTKFKTRSRDIEFIRLKRTFV